MEFWGVEVKHGVSLHVDPGVNMIVHISQAALGENNDNRKEPIRLYLTVGDEKLLIATLSHDKFPQMSMEILLKRGFELSHSWNNGSVFFSGYKKGMKLLNIPLSNNEDVEAEQDSKDVGDEEVEKVTTTAEVDTAEDEEDDTPKKIIKKRKNLPGGYGSAHFYSTKIVTSVYRDMQSDLLDRHCLVWRFPEHIWGSELVWKGSRELYVGNIASEATCEEVSQLFSPFGKIIRLSIPVGHANQHAGYAFIKFRTRQEALNAKEALSRTHFYGRHLVLKWAKNDDVQLPSIWFEDI